MFSVGILYSAQEFIKFVNTTREVGLEFPEVFKTFAVASPKAILQVCQKCEWVRLNISGCLEVTDRGKMILDSYEPDLALRIQLGHLIEASLPPWIPLLSRGRAEAQKYLPVDVVQCLREAGLFGSVSDDVVSWWDRYSKVSRKVSKDAKLDIGRLGEKLSLQHERQRTKREPVWQGFESNLSGFDILSVLDENDSTSLRIEVKTSNSTPDVALFFISKNEWSVAQASSHYLFHLWSLQPKPQLRKIAVDQVESHVPVDQGSGEWESVSIPFAVFV